MLVRKAVRENYFYMYQSDIAISVQYTRTHSCVCHVLVFLFFCRFFLFPIEEQIKKKTKSNPERVRAVQSESRQLWFSPSAQLRQFVRSSRADTKAAVPPAFVDRRSSLSPDSIPSVLEDSPFCLGSPWQYLCTRVAVPRLLFAFVLSRKQSERCVANTAMLRCQSVFPFPDHTALTLSGLDQVLNLLRCVYEKERNDRKKEKPGHITRSLCVYCSVPNWYTYIRLVQVKIT